MPRETSFLRSPFALGVAAIALATACVSVLPPLPPRRMAPVPPPAPARAPVPIDTEPANDFEATLSSNPAKFGSLLVAAESLRLQILYSEVVDDGAGHKALKRHGYRADAEYFYPASAIKLCAAIAALEKLSALRRTSGAADLRPTTKARVYSIQESDSASASFFTTSIGQEVRAALVVSENESYNRLFAFVGHRELNERMWSLGARSVRAQHRVGAVSATDDAHVTPRIDLVLPGGKAITIPKRVSTLVVERPEVPGLDVGRARVEGGRVVAGPMPFAMRNRVSLRDLQDLLIKVARPELLPASPPLELDDPERAFLLDVLRTVPSESRSPTYPPGEVSDVVHKPFLPGLLRVVPRDKFALYSKGGRAYGFRVENAYVEGLQGGGAFFLAAAMYADADGTVNDDVYDYDAIAEPFLTDLAELVARSVF